MYLQSTYYDFFFSNIINYFNEWLDQRRCLTNINYSILTGQEILIIFNIFSKKVFIA